MLYITTRDDKDAYTAYRAMHENRAPDGGAYIPFRMPVFLTDELAAFASGSFGQTVAEILNRFFSCHLTVWDVDFCIGRNAVRLAEMSHRMVIAELWHNPEGIYDHICSSLYNKLCDIKSRAPSEWFVLAVHISVLFGIYTEMCRTNLIRAGDKIDLTIMAEDLSVPVAALYARQMGLPVDVIILTSAQNSGLWDMVHLGELGPASEATDSIGYERLIHVTMGNHGVTALRDAIHANKTFRIDADHLAIFNRGLFCAVTGKERSIQNINSIYRSNAYFLDPAGALSVGGLQDYRAKTGESKLSLVLSCESPMNCIPQISTATGISQEKLVSLLKSPLERRQ